MTFCEWCCIAEAKEAGDGVAEDGDQAHGGELLVVEVDERLNHLKTNFDVKLGKLLKLTLGS